MKNIHIIILLMFLSTYSLMAEKSSDTKSTSCKPISKIMIDHMDEEGIIVQWESDGTETKWEVVCDLPGTNPDKDGIKRTTDNYFYKLTSLDKNQYYQIAVRAVCDAINVSEWTYIYTRFIAEDYAYLPYRQSFDADSLNQKVGFVCGMNNIWFLGTVSDENYLQKEKALFVSNDAGQSNTYSSEQSAINYAYVDFYVPDNASNLHIEFKLKSPIVENLKNGVKVYLMPTNTTLDINELPYELYQIGKPIYNNYWIQESIDIPAQNKDGVNKLVFVWINEKTTVANNYQAAVIDDIYIDMEDNSCQIPKDLRCNVIDFETATLSWVSEAPSFNLQYKKKDASEWIQINNITSDYKLEGLEEKTTYYYRVGAVCQDNSSFFSLISSFITPNRISIPLSFSVSATSYDEAKFIYNVDQTASGVSLEYAVVGLNDTVFIEQNTMNLTNLTITNLLPSTEYIARLRAFSTKEDTSDYTKTISFKTECDIVSVYPYQTLNDTVKFTTEYINNPECWSKSGVILRSPYFDLSGVDMPRVTFDYKFKDPYLLSSFLFKASLGKYSEAGSSIVGFPKTENMIHCEIDLLSYASKNCVRFFIELMDITPDVEFEITNFKIEDYCKTSDIISAFQITSKSVYLDWDRYSNNKSWDMVLYNLKTEDSLVLKIENVPYKLENLTPNTDYYVKIKSNCKLNDADYWVGGYFRTPLPNECPVPTNFKVEHFQPQTKGEETIICTWDIVRDEISWEVEYKQKWAVAYQREIVNINPRFTLRNLELGEEYEFRVRTICSEGDTSNWTSFVGVSLGALQDDYIPDSSIMIYPNPVKDYIRIDAKVNPYLISKTSLVDMNGKIIANWENLPSSIDVSMYCSGVYYLQIHLNSQRTISKKIIIQ